MNSNKDDYLFILDSSQLRYNNQNLNNAQQHYLWSRIGNKFNKKRKISNNRNKLALKPLLAKFLHVKNL